jgi:hypothetical protein
MRIRKCAFALLLFAALVAGLCPTAAIASSPLLAQSGPAEAEKPTNEKPSSDEEKISPEKTILGNYRRVGDFPVWRGATGPGL